ncbi:ROK family transcriptional regulator [Catenulispora rubra]|uniref:ROK family transcriptional regulator n=1 Tax=Catenulispora rubra TaxID=280293 RepID=UPI0018923920|nr:ROK family protein [Catenulispora rubra]
MTTNGGDRSLLRRINLLATLRSAREAPKTIAGFAAATGLSRTAAEAVVLDLVDLGWLVEDGQGGHPGAGRPARHYRLRAEAGVLLGVDVGPHNIVATVADLRGEPLGSAHHTVSKAASTRSRLDAVLAVICQALENADRSLTDVWVAAVGVPGVVRQGRVEQVADPAGSPEPDLAGHLRTLLGRPVLVENDCNLAAVAEHWRGVAQDVDDLVFVHSGNRTSAGLVLAGRLHRGHSGGAGEIGALAQIGWEDAPARLEALLAGGRAGSRKEVFALASRGDEEALAAVDAFSQGLAFGIAALALAVDPQMVVIGGGNVRAGDTLLIPLQRYIAEFTYSRIPTVGVSTLGNQSVSLGAVRLALDAIDEFLEVAVIAAAGFPPPTVATFAGLDVRDAR